MSYDVSIDVPAGPEASVTAYDRNYTSNMSFLWTAALDLPEQPYLRDGEPVYGGTIIGRTTDDRPIWGQTQIMNRGLRLLDGAPCSEAAGVLARAAVRVRTPELRALGLAQQPDNGWGDYESAAQFLEELAAATARFSLGTIRVHS